MDGNDAPVSQRERVYGGGARLGFESLRDIKNWRTRLQPIRTSAEITAHIKILSLRPPYLYQKLSKKATQLRLLGMSYQQIAKSLSINKRTAIRACKYKGSQQ